MARYGFTLVELLAVIVILAIILVIAIPNIINIISKSKLDVYKKNEAMLASATQLYLAQEGISLPNVGDTLTVFYSDLKNKNLIQTLKDVNSNSECNDVSKVIVSKTTAGYTYTPALVCNNYISLSVFNLVSNGDFSNGTTSWACGGAALSTANNILYVQANGTTQWVQPYQITQKIAKNGDKIYLRVYQKAPNITGISSTLMLNAGITQTVASTAANGTEKLVSGIVTLTGQTETNRINVYPATTYPSAAVANGSISENRDIIMLDLTDIYGAGNEPASVSVIGNLINSSR